VQDLGEYARRHPVIRAAPAEDLSVILDCLERHVVSKVYKAVFGPPDDHKRDAALDAKIRSLQVRPCQLVRRGWRNIHSSWTFSKVG
jgi:hypothetical protein